MSDNIYLILVVLGIGFMLYLETYWDNKRDEERASRLRQFAAWSESERQETPALKTRVYLAGPMTGIPQFNYPAFEAGAAELRALGYEVFNPAEIDDPRSKAEALASATGALEDVTETWGDFLARDVKLIADGGIEAVFVLPGWKRSRGARLETMVAHLVGIYVYTLDSEPVGPLELARAWVGENWRGVELAVLESMVRKGKQR